MGWRNPLCLLHTYFVGPLGLQWVMEDCTVTVAKVFRALNRLPAFFCTHVVPVCCACVLCVCCVCVLCVCVVCVCCVCVLCVCLCDVKRGGMEECGRVIRVLWNED